MTKNVVNLRATSGNLRGLFGRSFGQRKPAGQEKATAKQVALGPIGPMLLLGAVALLVLYPLLALLLHSFQTGATAAWSLSAWETLVAQPRMREAAFNTLSFAATRQFIAFPLGLLTAWLLARTDLPGRSWIELGFWAALFMPALPALMGFILLFDGESGLVNLALMQLPFVSGPVFDIYSWWGIVFAGLGIGILPVTVFLLTPVLRNLDAALDASAASGASSTATLLRVGVPLMFPAMLVAVLFGLVRSMHSFELELVLGSRDQINIFSTLLYQEALGSSGHGVANAVGVVLMAIIAPFLVAQHFASRRASRVSLGSGRVRERRSLGLWKWPATVLVFGLIAGMTVLPAVMLLVGSVMQEFGEFGLLGAYTLAHWQSALEAPRTLDALRNTLLLGVGAALVAVVVCTFIAYTTLRTTFSGRRELDLLVWPTAAVPGVVLGFGLLWLFRDIPVFGALGGTVLALIIAVVLGNLTIGVHMIKARLVEIGADLEEMSWALGGDPIYTFKRVLLPLLTPVFIVVGLQVFVSAVSVVGLLALLGTPGNMPLSLLQLSHLESGGYESAAVVGVLVLGITLAAALAARVLGLRMGLGRG